MLDLIVRHVEEQPDHAALVDGAHRWSYAELWARSGRIAAALGALGVTTGSRVGVHGPRSAAHAAALLGVLRAGAVMVPLSTAHPPARATAMVAGAGVTHLVAVGAAPAWAGAHDVLVVADDASVTGAAATAADPGAPPTSAAAPGDDAAIFFTSGTTGTPKAVRVPHLAIVDLATWYGRAFAISPADRVSMVTNVGFVVTLRNLFAPLAAGATVCVAPDELLPEDGLAWVANAGVTVLHTTPTTAQQWLRHAPVDAPRPVLRWTLFGGEPLEDRVVKAWRDAVDGSRRVANVYGATEVAASRAWYEVPAEPEPGVQPIGRAIPGTQLLVVDERGALCATGVVGELVVRARSIPASYANDAPGTNPYGANPFRRDDADRVCRTGDRAFVGADGDVRILGRVDDQVKLGGFRVDLGDVAAVLRGHEDVADAHVLVVPGDDDVPELAAFVVPRAAAGARPRTRLERALRRHCATQLPMRAVPARLVVIDHVPVGQTGKVDRRRLLALLDASAGAGAHARPDVRPDPTAPLPEPPRTTLLADVERWVRRDASHVALDDGTVSCTYGELWARADRIAGHLAAQGVGTGTPVLVTGPRSAAFAIAMLGVLRAGGVMVPGASMLPDARCLAMAEEIRAEHVVCVGDAPPWTGERRVLVLDAHGTPRDTMLATATPAAPGAHAYVFFTSGTTGAPKAVLGRHASLAAYLHWWRDAFGVGPDDRVSMVTSTAFDVTLRNLFGPLVSGATACIAPDGLLPEHGLRWLHDAAVTVLHVTPSLAGSWLAEADESRGVAPWALRWTLFAGEMLTDALVARWRAAVPGRVGNMYGPTETTMSRCLYVVPDEPIAGAQPVGVPLPGSQVLVVDEHDRLCDVGVPGEVLVRTRSGTSGYANNAAEHAARFVPNPFTGDPDDVVYRTGDRGWYREDGALQLAGRVDDQVKIGGVRVEPAEVAAALAAHPDVRAAHVQARRGAGDEPELVAFVATTVAPPARPRCTAALRRHLGALLPPAAIPARLVHVDRLPMTSNGKVDRAALLALLDAPVEDTTPAAAAPAVAADGPGTIDLDEMVALWRTVLRRDDIDADTNFFDVGGSSVTAVRLGHRLRERTGRTVGIHDLLDAQSPRELAAHLSPGTSAHDDACTSTTAHDATTAVHRLVAEHARTRPDACAIEADGEPVTYAVLERRVRAMACVLVEHGVAPGSLVAVHATRTAALVPLLLAVHRAGAGYVPVDPTLPAARLAFVLDDCAPHLVVTDRPLPEQACAHRTLALDELVEAWDRAPHAGDPDDVVVADDPERVAYVIYTSGSTGNPKGVLVPQRALRAFVDAANERYELRDTDRLLQYHSLSFDTSVEEIFCTLAAGATLVATAAPLLGSAGWFLEQIASMRVSVLDLPTSFWTALTEDLDDAGLTIPPCVRAVIVGGSAASAEAVARFVARTGGRIALVNAYGPTECTIAATAADLSRSVVVPGEPVSIGPALSGVRTLVLDAANRPVADDEPGELLLGGAQLALGYLNRPELTAERFVLDPTGATQDRYYRTGDRVRRRADGSFVFEARVDDQVKIRGHRFELGEVEATFASHAAVREAVALLEDTGRDPQLVVHVVLRDGHDPSVEELRAHAAALLPAYALPTRIERRSSIPRTPGGKPDRRALRSGVRAPLGFAQEMQWFLHRFEPESTAYNLTFALRLRGPLDLAALDHALQLLAERHEALRTRFLDDDGNPVQVIDEYTPVVVETAVLDVREGECTDDAARRALLALSDERFDLERGPLYRPVLVEIGADDHLLVVRSHHIVVDGWSVDVLTAELLEAYRARTEGRAPELPSDVVQPRTLAAAEREAEADGSLDAAVERCVDRLTPLPAPLALPLDRPRPATREPLGRTCRAACAPGTAARLGAAARELRTTPFAIGIALVAEYLASRCDAPELVIGTPSADRDAPGSDHTVGMLVNTLAVRLVAHRDDRTVRDAVHDATRTVRAAVADKAAPFERVVRALHPPRTAGVHPVFQVMFQVTAAPRALGRAGALAVEPFLSGRAGAKFDCSVDLVLGDEASCRLLYATDVLDDATAESLAHGFASFVSHALDDLDRAVDAVRAATGLRPPSGTALATPAPPATPLPGRAGAPRVPARPAERPTERPAGDAAATVAAIMGELLGRTVGVDDDFFGAGGHSLLAVRLCSAVERALGVRLGVAAVFEAPTPRALARLLGDDAPGDAPDTADVLGPVLEAFTTALGGRRVDADDDFFALGGHSLLAVKVCSIIERTLGTRLPVALLFEHPTARAVAAHLTGTPPPSATSAPAPAPAPAPTAGAPSLDAPPAVDLGAPDAAARPARPDAAGGALVRPARLHLRRAPLSFAQRRLWALEQLGEAGDAYLLTSTYDLHGVLDLDALRTAMQITAARHEVLRTRYVCDDAEPEQVIDATSDASLVVLDARDAPGDVDALVRAHARAPFDLAREHTWRVVVARVDDGHHVLALTVHHLATDGESQGIILRDLARAYTGARTGADSTDPEPLVQYADHAVWQHARLASGALEPSLTWWAERLRPLPEPLRLPSGTARPPRPSGSGRDVRLPGGAGRRARVDALARAERTTPFTVLLAAYAVLLHRLTGRSDLVIGIPVTERDMDVDAGTVGFYVNTVPVRIDVDAGGSLRALLRDVQRALTDAIAHADAPFDLVIDRLAVPRDPSTTPLVQTMFSVQDAGGRPPRFHGLRTRRRAIGGATSAKFDLTLFVLQGDDLAFELEYRDDVFTHDIVESWGHAYLRVLDALVDDDGLDVAGVPLLDDDTAAWLVHGCNDTRTDYPSSATVHELFAEVATARAGSVAVIDGTRTCTYDELLVAARELAARLRAAGVGPGDRVALELGRSLELVIAMLATLEAGAAYVPVDPTYPDVRRALMVELAGAAATVTARDGSLHVVGHAPANGPVTTATTTTDPLAPAYVMFTSGSTGTPKGVVVPHRAIVRLARDTDYVAFGDDLVLAHLSNTSFDAATFEIWGALLNGARLVVLDADTVSSPAAFAEAVRAHGITTMFVTTALFNVLAREAPGAFAPVRDVLFGGEAADPHAVRAVLQDRPPARLVNVYGPTESTTFASWHLVERLSPDATTVPIGRPISNTTLHVVDAQLRPVPPLVEGELVIGGDGLALGYLGDDELTAARFVADPISGTPGARLYRTGDIVRRRTDGAIEFVGRRDHQVKIRGFRIELGDIEASLRALPGVDAAHVLVHRASADADPQVLAYAVPGRGAALDGGALRDALRAQLPAYLVPSAVLVIDALPINANGKIDRAALPVPSRATTAGDAACRTTPGDALEEALAAIWVDVLGHDAFGVEDGFFEIGGNSIRAVRAFAAIERATGVRLALSALFEAPTVRGLATLVRAARPALGEHGEAEDAAADDGLFVTLRAGDPSSTPLYCVHPAGGQVFAYAKLLPALAENQTVIGIREHGWADPSQRLASVEAYAARYADALCARQPSGPLVLAGYSLGGLLAYEMARLLDARGRDVRGVLLLDAAPATPAVAPDAGTATGDGEGAGSKLRRRLRRDGVRGVVAGVRRVVHRRWLRVWTWPAEARRDRRALRAATRAGRDPDPILLGRVSERAGMELRRAYVPEPYDGRLVFFRAMGTDPDFPIPDDSVRWTPFVHDLTVVQVPGNHANEGSMMTEPYVQVLAARIAEALAAVTDGAR